ncbi:MAG TPA: DUF559 domain-containing protein [Solirubrobacteraceae bacterium]|nr:DUF559 domain-containing protein [Solirubrobacteraceae bacterium]
MEAVAVAAAARLACGDDAALSHDTAAALWGLHDRWPARPEVSSGPGRRVRISGIRHHRTKTLMRADVRRHRGLRVTSPARTLNDLRPRLSERQYVRLINDARLKGLLNADAAAALHPDARAEQPPSRSVFEDEVASALRHGGFPDFQVNVRLFGREVDLLFEAQKLIVELDGWAYHSDRDAHERDRVKDAQALARGYVTVRITWRRWRSARAEVMAELEAVLRRAA